MPKVTVAIPTYNRKEYLKDAISSILNQSFLDFQIIIFDNHSDYDIYEFISQFNDDRIICIKNETNIGNLLNFQKIFNYKYDTEYLVVFHDDDVMHPKMLEVEVDIMEMHKNVVIIGSDLSFVHDHNLMFKFDDLKYNKDKINIIDYKQLIKLIIKDFDLCFDSIMYRTSHLNDLSEYQNTYFKWCDRPFVIDIAKKGEAVIINEKLVNYRIHKGQDSQAENKNYLNSLLNLFNYYKVNFLEESNTSNEKLFYRYSTNNLFLSLSMFSDNFIDYFKLLKLVRNKKLLLFKYTNFRGVYYFLKAMIILIKK